MEVYWPLLAPAYAVIKLGLESRGKGQYVLSCCRPTYIRVNLSIYNIKARLSKFEICHLKLVTLFIAS